LIISQKIFLSIADCCSSVHISQKEGKKGLPMVGGVNDTAADQWWAAVDH
jgi:hypothetical protein